jgi:hypothetical protein
MPQAAFARAHATVQRKNSRMDKSAFEVLDVQAVTTDNPHSAIKTFKYDQSAAVKNIDCDILIAGGGVGGTAAAIKLSQAHPQLKVCLTEETDWLGGQMTAQGVSALDENYLVETSGSCRSYQTFRSDIRAIYKRFRLSDTGSAQQFLHPGTSWVTYLAFEPKTALQVIDSRLNDAIISGALQVFKRTKVVAVDTKKSKSSVAIRAVNLDSGEFIAIRAKLCLDATELGDLLPLAQIPYRLGSDNRSDTSETHAPETGDRENVQDIVYPFVVDFRPGTSNTIAKPKEFDRFNDAGKFSFDGYKMFENAFLAEEGNREVLPFWTYRRLIARENFDDAMYPFDMAMINWDSNDLRGYNIIDQTPTVEAERLALAKSCSLGFLYWLQTLAPRDDGGQGYPELLLRTDVLGSADGLSKFPYIRESRRIVAKKTIVENDVVAAANPGARAKRCPDSLGIGLYPVDIHGRQEVPGAGQATKPFQLPMSSLVPEAGGRIVPACKNLGVTHITNGAYRLHPVEWAIGEAQAAVAAYCIKHNLAPEQVLEQNKHLLSVQIDLLNGGSPLLWFDDVATDHPAFKAIQFCVLSGLLAMNDNSLHFQPDEPAKISDLIAALSALFEWKVTKTENGGSDFETLLQTATKQGYFRKTSVGEVDGQATLTVEDMESCTEKTSNKLELRPTHADSHLPAAVTRSELAEWLEKTASHKLHVLQH